VGRRSLSVARLQENLSDKLTQQLRRLNVVVNRTQFRAQLYEEEMVDLVRDMAFSNDSSLDHRLKCAVQVVQWARGGIETWRHDKETMEADSPVITGGTVGEAIDEARNAADLFGRLDGMVRRKVPFRDWPEDIKTLAESEAFRDLEESEPGLQGDDVLIGIAAPLDEKG
jgi:hypothetical protein